MDLDQLKNRIEWLDEERRKDKSTISDLQNKILKIEGLQDKSDSQTKEFSSELTRLSVVISKIDKFEVELSKNNVENKKAIDAQDARIKRSEKENKKAQKVEIQSLTRTIEEINEELKSQDKLRDEIKLRKENENRFNKIFAETEVMVNKFKDGEATRNQIVKTIELERSKDEKKLADLKGEFSALKKRSDTNKVKLELTEESQKKIENRISDTLHFEKDRMEKQKVFLQKVRLEQSEKDKLWKEWNLRFETFDEKTSQLENFLRDFTDSELAVRKAEESFNQISEQISRRIHEITEIQRLGEEKFRQEWASFKADDQKRWANYTLTEEEQFRETSRKIEGLGDQTTNLEDIFQELQDNVQHLKEQSDIRMQTLLATFREWVSEEERFSNNLG